MNTIYTEIANEIFDNVYDRLQYEAYISTFEDIEVQAGEEVYSIPCRIRGEKTSFESYPGDRENPPAYDDRLWLTIEVAGDVSYEDENGDQLWLPAENLRAAMHEEGYDYYEE